MLRFIFLVLAGVGFYTAINLSSKAIVCTTTETQVECAARAAELTD